MKELRKDLDYILAHHGKKFSYNTLLHGFDFEKLFFYENNYGVFYGVTRNKRLSAKHFILNTRLNTSCIANVLEALYE